MKTILKIEGSACGKFNQAQHAEFHLTMFNKVLTVDVSKTNIPQPLIDEWKTNIDLEVDASRQARASVETQEMIKLDADRDNTLSYIFGIIDNAQRSPVPDHRSAYTHLEPIIRSCKGIQNEAYDQETLHIRALVVDFAKEPTATFIAMLGLTEILLTLTTINEEYATLRGQRSDTRVATAIDSSKTLRPKTDECYQQVCSLIYTSQMLAADPATAEEITNLIRQMNQITGEFKASYNQSMAQKSSKKAKTNNEELKM